jgi:hypothetical protein
MKYKVKVYEVYSTIIEVDADSIPEAKNMVETILLHGSYPDGTDIDVGNFEYTMNSTDWDIV